MTMRLGFWTRAGLLGISLLLIGWAGAAHWTEMVLWARETQRGLHGDLARALRALRSGDPAALAALIGASFFYGVAHAVGPGHGKVAVSGAALASKSLAWRMAGIGMAASLTQGLTAILLAYGALGLFSLSRSWTINAAERWLEPLSAGMIAVIGLWIAWGGARMLFQREKAGAVPGHDHEREQGHAHGPGCAAGCRHGPTAQEADAAKGWLGAGALVLGIGARPCSGALIVLTISWSLGLYWAGALSALAMAVGTGLVVSGVGLAASLLRDAHALRRPDGASLQLFALARLGAGLAVTLLSAAYLQAVLSY